MMASEEKKLVSKSSELPSGILFVEDNEDHFVLARHQLRKLKITNHAARVTTVDEMVAYLGGAGVYGDRTKYPLPTVIFLDLRLPQRGGLEAQAWLRSKLKYRNIPIVVISTPDMVTMLESAVRLGANARMTKPFNGQEFLRVVLEQKLPVTFAD